MKPIKLSGLSIEQTAEIIPPSTILLGYVGSVAYGISLPKDDPHFVDDIDLLGVCIADEGVYLGLKNFEQKEAKKDVYDSVVYEIRKFFRLLLKQNPNVLTLLWLQEKDYVHISESGRLLLENRNMFVSKSAYYSFVGYAHGQLSRITKFTFKGYMGEKRKKIVEQYGWDLKNGAHLIRLLRMGVEFLTDGELHVFRPDAEKLKEIKQGKWSLDKVQREADRLFVLAREAFVRSSLPASPDFAGAEKLLISILRKKLKSCWFESDHPAMRGDDR